MNTHVQQARAQSKPDPYLILSVGKKTVQTAVQMRNDSPVWEQGFTFLVANPDNDTLQLRIVDQKTEKEIGRCTYILSGLLAADNMSITAQPFRLQKSGAESIVTMSLVMRIFKKAEQEDTQSSPTSGRRIADTLSRTSSVRSHSEVSTTTSTGGGPVPTLQKQDSKMSVHSQFAPADDDSVGGGSSAAIVEESDFVESTEAAAQQLSASPSFLQKTLTHRTPSVTSSAGAAGLGRIQLTLRYSIHRQRLIVIVHKIM